MSTTRSPGTLRGGSIIKRVSSLYSQEQVYQYLDRIAYPGAQEYNTTKSHQPSLENLTHLTRHHLIAFPFENTPMHYTPEHAMDISPEGVFNRLVVNKIGGSYCYGQNTFLLRMLRSLGYRAYSGQARVNSSYPHVDTFAFGPLDHAVLFVQPTEGSNQTYLVDVGFGSPVLARPILLAEGVPSPGAMAPEMHVLSCIPHPESSIESDPSQFHRLWRLETYHEGNDPVVHQVLYTFSEQEAFPADFDYGSFVIYQKPGTFFGNNIIACRFIRLSDDDTTFTSNLDNQRSTATPQKSVDDDNAEPLVRYTLFGGQVKRVAGAESTVIRELTSESQRIQALREVFGLKVPDEAEKYIQGRVPAFNSAKGD